MDEQLDFSLVEMSAVAKDALTTAGLEMSSVLRMGEGMAAKKARLLERQKAEAWGEGKDSRLDKQLDLSQVEMSAVAKDALTAAGFEMSSVLEMGEEMAAKKARQLVRK